MKRVRTVLELSLVVAFVIAIPVMTYTKRLFRGEISELPFTGEINVCSDTSQGCDVQYTGVEGLVNAINTASEDDVINIQNGTYSFDPTDAGYPHAGLTIQNKSGITLAGVGEIPPVFDFSNGDWQNGILVENSENIQIENIEITGVKGEAAATPGQDLSASTILAGTIDGGNHQITTLIQNTGETPVSNFSVNLWVDPDPVPPDIPTASLTEAEDFFGIELAPGSSMQWSKTFAPLDIPGGDHQIYIWVDMLNTIAEVNESNNILNGPYDPTSATSQATSIVLADAKESQFDIASTQAGPAAFPDVSADALTFEPLEDGYEFTGIIQNNGQLDLQDIELSMFIDPDTDFSQPPASGDAVDALTRRTATISLGAGDTFTWVVAFPEVEIPLGQHTAAVYADYPQEETSENNNATLISFSAEPPPAPILAPDLVIEAIELIPRSNGEHDIIVVVQNIGDDAAVNFPLNFYIDPSPPPPNAVTSVFYQDVELVSTELNPGDTYEWTMSLTQDQLPPGTYQFFGWVDNTNEILELQELNNILHTTNSTTLDIAANGISIVDAGDNYEIHSLIQNTSPVELSNVRLSLYVNPDTIPPASSISALIQEETTRPFVQGQNYNWVVEVPKSDLPNGSHTVVVWADSSEEYTEDDESNNIATQTLDIEVDTPELDGSAAILDIRTSELAIPNLYTDIEINNIGTAPAGADIGRWVNGIEVREYAYVNVDDVRILNSIGHPLKGVGVTGRTETSGVIDAHEIRAENNSGSIFVSRMDLTLTNSLIKNNVLSGVQCGNPFVTDSEGNSIDDAVCNVHNSIIHSNAIFFCDDINSCVDITAAIKLEGLSTLEATNNIIAGKVDRNGDPVRYGILDLRGLDAGAGEPPPAPTIRNIIFYDHNDAHYAGKDYGSDVLSILDRELPTDSVILETAADFTGLFRNYPDDYRLSENSSAINAGADIDTKQDIDGSRADIGAFGGPQGDWEPIANDTSFIEPNNDQVCGVISGELIDYNSSSPVRIVVEDRDQIILGSEGGYPELATVNTIEGGTFLINLQDVLPAEYKDEQAHTIGLRALNIGTRDILKPNTLGSWMDENFFEESITCLSLNQPPEILSGQGPINVTEGNSYLPAYTIDARDLPDDLDGTSLTYGINNVDCPVDDIPECGIIPSLPEGVTFNSAAHAIDYEVPEGIDFGGEDHISFQVLVWVSDGELFDWQVVTFNVYPADQPSNDPSILISHNCPSNDISVGTSLSCSITAEVTPADYEVKSTEVSIEPAASWISKVQTADGYDLSGTAEKGTHTVTVTTVAELSTDPSQTVTETITFTITVVEEIQVNQDPVCTPQGVNSIIVGDTFNVTPIATDPNGDNLFFTPTAGTIPAGSIVNGNSFSWTPTTEQIGTYENIAIVASDTKGGVAACIYNLTVNEAPAAADVTLKIEYTLKHKVSVDTYPLSQLFTFEIQESDNTAAPIISGTVGVGQSGLTNQITDAQLEAGKSYKMYIKPRYYLAQVTTKELTSGENTITFELPFVPGDWNDDAATGSPNLINSLDYAVHKLYRTETDLTQLFDPNGEHPVSARDFAIYSLYLQQGGAAPLSSQ